MLVVSVRWTFELLNVPRSTPVLPTKVAEALVDDRASTISTLLRHFCPARAAYHPMRLPGSLINKDVQ